MRIDLHLHTTASDGTLSPAETVRQAAAGRLDVIAITDHDSCAGVGEAVDAAEGSALTVVSGAELSAYHDGRDVHILGYGVAPGSEVIRRYDIRAREARTARMAAMVGRLRDEGVEVTLDEVVEQAQEGRAMVGRPHLAAALVARGRVDSLAEAFDTLIGNEHPAYVPTELASPREALETILDAGGIPVWAHPPRDLLETLLGELVEQGLAGLEAYRPGWSSQRQRQTARLARDRGLLVSGGSDWHGPQRNGALGDFWVQPNQVGELLAALELV